MLLFKRKFQTAIRTGAKTQTVRFWRRQIVRPGDVHFAPGVGYLRVNGVEETSVARLTEADAQADGFASLVALKEELDRIYSRDGRQGRRCYRITFEYLGPSRPR
jgi:hypothetical protein